MPFGTIAASRYLLLASSVFAGVVLADGEDTKKTPVKSRLMEEVVVTAQKRAENLQDVPVSVAAFSGDMLAAMGVDDAMDLQNVTPGLTYNSTYGFTIVYLRGVGSDAFLMADPSVATYIDNIYYPFSSGLAQSFGRVERIEVLKGPQGTLFGRNTTGGAISITTETPSVEEVYGTVDASYGSFDAVKLRGLVNIPVSDDLAATLAIFHEESETYYDFDPESVQQGGEKEVAKGYRIKAKWIQEHFDVLLAAVRVDQAGYGTALSPNTAPSSLARTFGAEAQPRDHTAAVDAPLDFNIDSEVYFAELNGYFAGFDSKLLLSKQSIYNTGLTDFDGTNSPILAFSAPIYSDVKTAELQFLSNDESWGNQWLEWIGGFYYIDSVAGLDPDLGLFGAEGGDVMGVPISETIALMPPDLAALVGSLPLTSGANLALHGLLATESYAAFLQTTFTLTDWMELTLGGRYQEEERVVLRSSSGTRNADGSETETADRVNDGEGFNSVESTNFSPKVAVNFIPAEDLIVYASWQEGYKSGTFNTINVTDDIDYAEAELVEAYEIGVKFTHPDGYTINAAVFHTDIENIQVQFSSLFRGGAVSFENAGAGRIRGFDFDARALLFPGFFDNLVLSASGAYLDAIYTDYRDGTGYNDDTGFYETGRDFTGNRMVRTPEYTATAALSKTFGLPGGPLEVVVDAYYNSGYPYQAQNTLFYEKEYHLINARVSYLIEDWDLRITASGKNLSDSVYAYSQFPSDFGRQESLAPPRNYNLAIVWNF